VDPDPDRKDQKLFVGSVSETQGYGCGSGTGFEPYQKIISNAFHNFNFFICKSQAPTAEEELAENEVRAPLSRPVLDTGQPGGGGEETGADERKRTGEISQNSVKR
jgi:hypothetical protein